MTTTAPTKRKRRLLRFSIRTLLVVLTVSCVVAGMVRHYKSMSTYHQITITTELGGGGFPGSDPLDLPGSGLISDAKTWETIWNSWARHSGGEDAGETPAVDFDPNFVFFLKGDGNQFSVWRGLFCNGYGDLKGNIPQNLVFFFRPSFSYKFIVMPRFKCKTFNGRRISTIRLD